MISKNFKMVHIRTKAGPRVQDFFIFGGCCFLYVLLCYLKGFKIKRSNINENKQKNRDKVKISKNTHFFEKTSVLSGFLSAQLFETCFKIRF